jgi:Signal transduction histidine kinase
MKSLHRRLTWLYTITTGMILTMALAGFFMLRIRETRQAQLDSFYILWNSLSSRLSSDTAISHSFLAQVEVDSQSIIHIEENGTPLIFSGSWTPATERQILIERAKKQANAQGISTSTAPVSSSSLASTLLTIDGENQDQYYAMVLVLSHKNGVRSLCLVSCLPPILKTLKKTLFVLFGLDLAGILCLLFFSWNFVEWSLRPVEESRRKQAEFIAAASHELRSPLAVLRSGCAAVLAAPTQKETLLKTMDSECARMSRLIDDMLFLASADAKTWDIRLVQTDMDTLLIETYEAFLPACSDKQIALRLELPKEPLPLALADPERIRQILFILLDNALSYTPANKEIRIHASLNSDFHPRTLASAQYLALQVIDQGCGIPDDVKDHVFDRFYRADKARSGKTHFGLGLSIAKELAKLHKGTITITDNPGGGSCFSLTLPL